MTAKAKLAESNFASLAEMMSAYAEEAVRLAWSEHRQRLDLSESSVDLLEKILDGQSVDKRVLADTVPIMSGDTAKADRYEYKSDCSLSY